ncbi:hypothetical protein Tco_1364537, partial [Tanacetum coccineum]
CNGGNLPGRFRVGNTIQYQDYEWYEALEDSDLKDESLRNKVALEESMNQEKESSRDENPIHTIGEYSKPSHGGYMNTIELPVGNNVVSLRSDTIRWVQKECSFHGLRSEDPNQHLKDFLKLVDLLDLDDENRERTRLRLFQFSLRGQANNWLERPPA